MPPCVSPAPLRAGVMQGMCHEGTASSTPVLSRYLVHLLLPCLGPWEALTGPGWGWAGGPTFPWHLPKILVPLCRGGSCLGEPGTLCPGARQSVCPGAVERGPVQGGSVGCLCPSTPLHCALPVPTTTSTYGDVPTAVPVPGWHRRSVSTSRSPVGSQPRPPRGDTVKRCCPALLLTPLSPVAGPASFPGMPALYK